MAKPRRQVIGQSVGRGPNGRFIRITEFRGAEINRTTRNDLGYVVVSHNFERAKVTLDELQAAIGPQLLGSANERAAKIQAAMRFATSQAYVRAATGRFSRGIYAKVQGIREGDKVGARIVVTALNYRETKFLTNLGGGGYFKAPGYPVGPYEIWARGAEDYFAEYRASRRNRPLKGADYRRVGRLETQDKIGRLKVPRRGTWFESERRGRGPSESRFIRDFFGRKRSTDRQSDFFIYPFKVQHPGFRRDVLADTALAFGADYVASGVEDVVSIHGRTISRDLVGGGTVSRYIPLTSIRLAEKKATISSRRRFS